MIFDVLTIFPGIIKSYINESIIKRAQQKGLVKITVTDIRTFSTDKHNTVDDYPYSGGAGMVMKIEPIYYALKHVKSDVIKKHCILLSPSGDIFNQEKAETLLKKHEGLILLCGRYEGIDARIKYLVDEELSIGDFILTGGEIASLIIIDSITRLIPGVLGDERSLKEESFTSGILDYPNYTRPHEFKGMKVPEVLLEGDHKKIKRWRKKEALRSTLLKKPYLLNESNLSEDDLKILEEIKEEIKK